jgi:hypothetical protein
MMLSMVNHPKILSLACLLSMWAIAFFGAWLRVRFGSRPADQKSSETSLGIIVSATLTLLGLIIGFTFSMASTRYDQRRLFEENEANAIGTEYVRAELLPPAETASVKSLLLTYLEVRIHFYDDTYGPDIATNAARTNQFQAQLWQSIKPQAAAQPTPVTALVVSGMNDVLNSQGYTQFAWGNRIPIPAWWLMVIIALFSNLLVGYSTRRSRSGHLLLLVTPILVSVSFFLIADIDSPRGGIIRVHPTNLLSLSQTLQSAAKP